MNQPTRHDVYKKPTFQETQEALASMEVAPEGVSQKLAEAALTIIDLAAFYGSYNKAIAFDRAIKSPEKRMKVQGRMANDVDHVSAAMRGNTRDNYAEREARLFYPLAQSEALVEAGYDPADLEDAQLVCLISLRHKIGVGVDANTRASYIRSLRKTAGI